MSDIDVRSKPEANGKTNQVNDVEEMELDDRENVGEKALCDDDDAEEGEISDSKDADEDNINENEGRSTLDGLWDNSGCYENQSGGFITGIDFFGKEEQSKLEERAKRFGLGCADKVPTELQLKELYESLNMKLSEGLDKSYRLNALHMRGTENLSTQDIFSYFKDYAPSFIEWISDYACNVVWLDESSPARALIGLSQRITGLEAYHAKADPFHEKSDAEDEDSGDADSKDGDANDTSTEKEEVVVVVAEIEGEGGENDIMVVDTQKNISKREPVSAKVSSDPENKITGVRASDIEVPIPPGRWRKGIDHPKAKCILLRFSTRSDKKFPHIEKLSEYYKKHGNPNYGGMKGLITASRKRKYQRGVEFPTKVFEDDVGDERDFADSNCDDNKNPWGGLAQSWNRLDRIRGKQPGIVSPDRFSEEFPSVRSRSDMMALTSASKRETLLPHHNSNRPVFQRLGNVNTRQAREPSESEESRSSDSDDEQWTRRSKAPRMRMYADEEENRLEQRKTLVNLRVLSQRSLSPEDLRSRLERDGRARSRVQDNTPARNLPSVWSRLRPVEDTRPQQQDDDECSSSSTSDSDSDSDSDSASVSDSNSYSDEDSDAHTTNKVKKGVVDLRTKLDMKKSIKQPVSARQKSPLRIEIDNDEYYRLIGD